MNPYNNSQRPADNRPLYKRKRVWAASLALFTLGAVGGTQSAQDEASAAQALAKPVPTVTVTATQTTQPAPAPTVTKTKTVKTPGPTVTVTKTATRAGATTSGHSSNTSTGTGTGTGTCSIVSSAGNCYQAGQFCRNSDHGASTTTASGATIKCAYSANAWRWTYS
jgi:hypothetical protein